MDFTTEHEQKYEALAQRIGVEALRTLVAPAAERIKGALANGDVHLNTINLAWWDKKAGLLNPLTMFWSRPTLLSWSFPWLPSVANGLSLAERVCVLKHVARYHLEG